MSETEFDMCEWGEKYQIHMRWLRDSNFLKDLEKDNIDEDIIEEELISLRQADQPLTRRQKVVKMLRSQPVQTVLCAVVLLDACIVLAQLLLDINSVRARLHKRDTQWMKVIEFVSLTHPETPVNIDHTDPNIAILIHKVIQHYHNRNSQNHSMPSKITAHDAYTANSPQKASSITSPIVNGRNRTESAKNSENILRNKSVGSVEDLTVVYSGSDRAQGLRQEDYMGADDTLSPPVAEMSALGLVLERESMRGEEKHGSDPYHEASVSLNFLSITLLGFLMLEDIIRIVAMGRSIWRHKIEILDTVVIGTSFALDLVFIGGVSGEMGQKVAAALFVLLIWRVARVVDGIIKQVKQRQEFRIRLQRRARRKAERKLEAVEEEKAIHAIHAPRVTVSIQTTTHSKEMEALQDLCLRAGVRQGDIAAVCENKSPLRQSRMVYALTSVARLSVGMTMSPSFSSLSRYASESCLSTKSPLTGPLPLVSTCGLPEYAHIDRRSTLPTRRSASELFSAPADDISTILFHHSTGETNKRSHWKSKNSDLFKKLNRNGVKENSRFNTRFSRSVEDIHRAMALDELVKRKDGVGVGEGGGYTCPDPDMNNRDTMQYESSNSRVAKRTEYQTKHPEQDLLHL